MGDDLSQLIKDEYLAELHRTITVLQSRGVSSSPLQFKIWAPNTEFEAPAASVACTWKSISFGVTYEGYAGQTSVTSTLTIFSDEASETSGGPNDVLVAGFISWLEENAPVPLTVRRSYGRLITDALKTSIPEFPVRRDVGGSVIVEFPIAIPGVFAGYPLTDESIDSEIQGEQGPQHLGLSLEDALSRLLDFMSRAQDLEMLPEGSRWSFS